MFKKAEKKKQKLRLALCGPSGSGKTYSALTMAFGIFGENAKVCVIDTEHGSSELYSDKFPEYYVSNFVAPYSPEAYIKQIKDAEAFGADVIIIDSISHEWNGTGGCLEIVDNVTNASNSKNSYTSWKNVTPKHQAFIDCILASKVHIIATMRAKQEYALVEKNGKKTPEKIGMAPIQRDGMDYEFTLVIDFPGGGNFLATSSKDRTGFLSGKTFPIDKVFCESILKWLNSGAEFATDEQKEQIQILAERLSVEQRKIIKEKHGITGNSAWINMTKDVAVALIEELRLTKTDDVPIVKKTETQSEPLLDDEIPY
jgi:DNA polymerase III delta prime subunit